jgi:SAM-dependent methyltransferase
MEKSYYRKYYDYERKHWWFITRNNLLMQIIEKNIIKKGEKLKILNVGAGTGFTSELLSKYGEVISVEYESSCVEFVNANTSLHLLEGSILDLQFEDNTFDLVCAFDVVEHVEDDVKATSEMIRVAKRNGYVFISVPAFNSLWSKHDEINHHYRRYKKDQVMHFFLKDNKLQNIYNTYFNSFLFIPIYIVRKLNNLKEKIAGNKAKNIGESSTDFDVAGSGLSSKILKWLFSREIYIVRKKGSLPFGVSFTILAKKI